ncbi:AraC-like ligand-binding domain-containing protein [Streptomyces sp. NPDC004838]
MVVVTEFSTEDVPAAERFELYESTASRWHGRNVLRSERADDFLATLRILDLGGCHVTSMSCPHLHVTRTSRQAGSDGSEVFQLVLLLRGTGVFTQNRQETPVEAGHLLVIDNSRPFSGFLSPDGGALSSVIVYLPRRLLSLPPRTTAAVTAAAIPLNSGIGAVTAHWLTDLTTRAHQFRHSDAKALAEATTELLTTALDRHTAGSDAARPESRPHALRTEIRHFIRRHLGNPALTPTAIAAAHHISVGYLHRIFQDQGTSVAEWIRTQRLERLRHDLTDPRLHSTPLDTLARHNGFTNGTQARRLFRRTYDTTPGDYRDRTLEERRNQSRGQHREDS